MYSVFILGSRDELLTENTYETNNTDVIDLPGAVVWKRASCRSGQFFYERKNGDATRFCGHSGVRKGAARADGAEVPAEGWHHRGEFRQGDFDWLQSLCEPLWIAVSPRSVAAQGASWL